MGVCLCKNISNTWLGAKPLQVFILQSRMAVVLKRDGPLIKEDVVLFASPCRVLVGDCTLLEALP